MNTFKHSGSYGDMIFSLPTVIAAGGGDYYLRSDMVHHIGRLFEAQPYMKVKVLNDAEWKAFKPTHDLDLFRGSDKLSIVQMHLDAFKLTFDVKQSYLFNIPAKKIAKIVLNDSGGKTNSKFPGHTINWGLLKPHEKDCVFIGHEEEWKEFKEYRKLNVDFYKIQDLYEWAQIIEGSQLYIGNMTSGQCLAEGLKKPYCVDLYVGKPQYPLTTNSYVGLCEAILYWHLGIKYGAMPGVRPENQWCSTKSEWII